MTCLRESVEIDGPDMEGPRQRGKAGIAGENLAAARRAGIVLYGNIWSRWLWESICDALLLPGGRAGGLWRAWDGRRWGSCLEPFRMDAFSTRRIAPDGNSIPAVRSHTSHGIFSILFAPRMSTLYSSGVWLPAGLRVSNIDVIARTPPRTDPQTRASSSQKPVQRILRRWPHEGGSQRRRQYRI